MRLLFNGDKHLDIDKYIKSRTTVFHIPKTFINETTGETTAVYEDKELVFLTMGEITTLMMMSNAFAVDVCGFFTRYGGITPAQFKAVFLTSLNHQMIKLEELSQRDPKLYFFDNCLVRQQYSFLDGGKDQYGYHKTYVVHHRFAGDTLCRKFFRQHTETQRFHPECINERPLVCCLGTPKYVLVHCYEVTVYLDEVQSLDMCPRTQFFVDLINDGKFGQYIDWIFIAGKHKKDFINSIAL